MKQLLYILLLACMPLMGMAQDNKEDWQPTPSWPFILQEFSDAVITTASGQVLKAKANIHVGSNYVWYISGAQKKLEAKKGTIKKIAFENGKVFYAVNDKMCTILSEDTINGKVSRLYVTEELNKTEYDERVRANRAASMSVMDGSFGLTDFTTGVAESQGATRIEREALPMKNNFYMLYDGEEFQATESNILKHMPTKQERTAYRSFTRSAEILYSSKSSMMNVWKTFFVK